jgi:hypothetical protein
MRIVLALAAAFAATAAAAAPCNGPAPPLGATVVGQVQQVTSGGTFCLALPAGPIAVRLADFAACRTEAARLNRVACSITRHDRFGARARCTVEGQSVARVLRYAGTCERRR